MDTTFSIDTRRSIPTFAGLIVVAAILVLMLGTFTHADQTKPNFLFLFADDQRADTISAHGNPPYSNP